jgi:hypothetical protein
MDVYTQISIEKIRETEHERLIKNALETGEVPDYSMEYPPFRYQLLEEIENNPGKQYNNQCVPMEILLHFKKRIAAGQFAG